MSTTKLNIFLLPLFLFILCVGYTSHIWYQLKASQNYSHKSSQINDRLDSSSNSSYHTNNQYSLKLYLHLRDRISGDDSMQLSEK